MVHSQITFLLPPSKVSPDVTGAGVATVAAVVAEADVDRDKVTGLILTGEDAVTGTAGVTEAVVAGEDVVSGTAGVTGTVVTEEDVVTATAGVTGAEAVSWV